MRLWSLHPRYLDPKGLVALWREALLAQAVLRGATKGYTRHPQLQRFQQAARPLNAIAQYLVEVAREARRRGYAFDETRIAARPGRAKLTVTRGQLEHERKHLAEKLTVRAKHLAPALADAKLEVHPMFCVIAGPVEAWERAR